MISTPFGCLPIHPPPYRLESYTGYLSRLMEANKIGFLPFADMIWPGHPHHYNRTVTDIPSSFGELPTLAHCSLDLLRATTPWFLTEKFGRTYTQSGCSQFLNNSIAYHRRYCPLCLSEQPFYRLIWQFLPVQGCSQHQCFLQDTCHHCGQAVPLLSRRPRIGVCPHCLTHLAHNITVPLNAETYNLACANKQAFSMLLAPSGEPNTLFDNSELVRIALGSVLMNARQAQERSRRDIAQQSGVSDTYLYYVEWGYTRATLEHWLTAMACLNLSVADVFSEAYSKIRRVTVGVKDISQLHRNEIVLAFRAEDLLQQTERAIAHLKANQEAVTFKSVAAHVELGPGTLRRYPEIWRLIQHHAATSEHNLSNVRQQKEDALLQQVQDALDILRAEGKRITLSMLASQLGTSEPRLKRYPRVRKFLEQELDTMRRRVEEQHEDREQQVLDQVKDGVESLQRQGIRVTLGTLCAMIKRTAWYLKQFPRVRAYLEHHISTMSPPATEKVQTREQELRTRVETAIVALQEEQQAITLDNVSQRVSVMPKTLYDYPSVRQLLQYKLDRSPANRPERAQQYEEQLFTRVQEAVTLLRTHPEPLTCVRIAAEVKIHSRTLSTYKRIHEWVKEQCAQDRQQRQAEREQHLLACVQTGIAEMIAHNLPVTWTFIAQYTGEELKTLRSYPSVRNVAQHAIQQSKPVCKQVKITDEQIIEKVQQAITNLRQQNRTVTIEAIMQETNYSETTLRRSSNILQWIKTECAHDHNNRRQQKEADLVAKVADAIAHLQETNQFITWDTIAHYLEMQRCSLVATGRRYPRIRELIDEASSS